MDGFLHGGQRHELEQVVLDDVAGSADAVVVAGARADTDVFSHRNLHGIDVVGLPQRLEHGVREAHRHDVLDGFLAQVVVDAEDILLVKNLRDDVGELLRGLKVVSERLLDDDATPFAALSLVQAGIRQVLGHDGEVRRRNRQVEGVVAAGAAHPVELGDGVGEATVCFRVIEGSGDEA